MRTTRTVRRLLATAVTAGALFALPAAANAANTELRVDVSDPSPVIAGDVVNYTVTITNTGTANDTSAVAEVDFTLLQSSGVLNGTIGTPVLDTAASDNVNELLAFGVDNTGIDVPAGFTYDAVDGNPVVFTVPVTAPRAFATGFRLDLETSSSAPAEIADGDDTSTSQVVSKGGPSSIRFAGGKIGPAGTDGLLGRWVKKDTTAVGSVTVTNTGTGPASFVNVSVYATGSASLLSPTAPAPFTAYTPVATIGASGCAVLTASTCEIADLAAGASVTIPVTITGLTHYGNVSLDWDLNSKADSAFNDVALPECLVDCDFNNYAQVTDGTTAEPHNDVATDTTATNGGTDVSFKGELTNNGPAEIKGAILDVTAPSFNAVGDAVGGAYEGDAGISQSIQNVTVPGATCANYVDPISSKKRLDRVVCTIPSIPVGGRLLYSVGAKFATLKETSAGVTTQLNIASFATDASDTYDSDNVRLNVSKTTDISITAKSPALIGSGHVTPVDVTITNTGNTLAKTTWIEGDIQFGVGTFDGESQAPFCLSSVDPEHVRCSQGELAAGASRTVTIWVKAGTKLGALPVRLYAYHGGDGYDINEDNDDLVQTLTIVKANAAPLLGVTANKFKAAKLAAILKAGLKTEVKTPGAATVKVDLAVSPKVAVQLGLVKKAGKKNVVIGTKTMKVTKAGKVVVVTKFSLKYKAKVAKAKAKFAVMRVITVTSNEKKNAGATSLTTSTTSFTVVKAKKKK